MKKALRIVEIAITVLLCIILVLNLIMIVRKNIGHEKYPTVFGYGVGVIISGSMTGTINVDDMVLTKAQDEYHIGDIILFEEGTMLVTHRIVDQNSIGFITKGDANDSNDLSEVKQEAICGKVVKIIPKFGKVTQFLRTPLGLLLLLLAGILLAILPSFRNSRKDDNKASDKKNEKMPLSDRQEDGSEKTIELDEGSEKTIELTEGSEKTAELNEGAEKTMELSPGSGVTEELSIEELNRLIDDIENGQ